jgi:hypothetical protein
MIVLKEIDQNWAYFQYECDYCHGLIKEDTGGIVRVARKPGSRVQHLHEYCKDLMPMEPDFPYFFGLLEPIGASDELEK